MPLQEDDVLSAARAGIQGLGWRVLVASGNQIKRFRFSLPSGEQKAPDFVAARGSVLLLAEAKVSAAGLLHPNKGDWSDCDVMAWLAGTPAPHPSLLAEAHRVLEQIDAPDRPTVVVTALIWGNGMLERDRCGERVVRIRARPAHDVEILDDPSRLALPSV